ncbi:MAG: hypothetical protein JO015_16955 [Verrucomicrobia bacterium]|nr:hypothetical protein [Verrucomicrobiota bacterium]
MRIRLILAALLGFSGLAPAAAYHLDAATRFVVAAHDELPAPIWKRVLEVRLLPGNTVRHYLVFNLHHTFFCYSAHDGSRRIWPAGTNPAALARAISPATALTASFVQPADLRLSE